MIINNSYFYPDALLSVDELSKISGISKSTLYKNISESKRDKSKLLFPYIKISGKLMYRSKDIQSKIDEEFHRQLNIY